MVVNRQDAYRLSPLRCFHLRRLVHIQNLLSVTTGTTDALKQEEPTFRRACCARYTVRETVRQPGEDPEEGFNENLVGHRWLDRQRCCGR